MKNPAEIPSSTVATVSGGVADRSIEMKVICEIGVAERLAAHVLETYGPHYSVTLYFADVSVVRPEKF